MTRPPRPRGLPAEAELVATYTYTDADGIDVYHVDRWEPGEGDRAKTFRPFVDGARKYGLPESVPRVLYNLPDVITAVEAGTTIYLCEGEKDADNAAAEWDVVATSFAGGTAGWSSVRDHATRALRGAKVVIIADNDEPGRKHAEQAFHDLIDHARDVSVVMPPDAGSDASDITNAGRDLSDLVEITPTIPVEPAEDVTGDITDAAKFIATWRDRIIDGRTWLEQSSPEVRPLWGTPGEMIPAAIGQPTILCAFSGVGKTTISQRIALGRLGIPGFETLLGHPVTPFDDDDDRTVLYLASDRPDQARLALLRLVAGNEEALEICRRRLRVWPGPPPIAVNMRPQLLAEMAHEANAGLVIPDSLKDMALKLSTDEVAAGINQAHQICVAADIDIFAPHHPRKQNNSDAEERRPTIDDAYGGAWITNGAGSVLFLIREPTSIELVQVKSPTGNEGASIRFSHHTPTGTLTLGEKDQVEAAVYDAGKDGLNTPGVARWVHNGRDPERSEIEHVRRHLKKLAENGIVRQRKNSKNGDVWVHHEQ